MWQYDYERNSGTPTKRRIILNLPDRHPDALAIDHVETVFAAIYGSSQVAAFDVRGIVSLRLDLPVPNAASCAFGGKGLNRLFNTKLSRHV